MCSSDLAFMGLTLGCARCHDHKFDPIPQADYYRLLSFFRGLTSAKHVTDPNTSTAHVLLADPAAVAGWRKEQAARIRELEASVAALKDEKARKEVQGRIDALRRELPPFELALGAREGSATPPKTFVLKRGSARTPGEEAPSAFPVALSASGAPGAVPEARPGPGEIGRAHV